MVLWLVEDLGVIYLGPFLLKSIKIRMKKLINTVTMRLFGAIVFKNKTEIKPCGVKTVRWYTESCSFNEVMTHINNQLNRKLCE